MDINTTKISTLLAGFFLCLLALPALAQQPVFKVFSVTGKVQYASAGGKYTALPVAGELLGSETIIVPVGGAVNLICSNYQPVTLKKAGTFKVKDLSSQCKAETAALTTKYYEYVWHELLHKHEKPEDEPLKNSRNKGAVTRGCPGIRVIFPTDTLKLAEADWCFTWTPDYKGPTQISLFDKAAGGNKIFTFSAPDTTVSSATFKNKLSETNLNYLQLSPGKSTCNRLPIQKFSATQFLALLKPYAAQLPETGTSAFYFARSLVAADLKFLAEALTDLNKAIALEPANPVYRMQLKIFKSNYHVR